jgi:small subunit ribosomal protein S14
MHVYTRPTQIKNRCVASGTARSVFRDFRLNRVSTEIFMGDDGLRNGSLNNGLQFQFRMQALAGELPGVKKASW